MFYFEDGKEQKKMFKDLKGQKHGPHFLLKMGVLYGHVWANFYPFFKFFNSPSKDNAYFFTPEMKTSKKIFNENLKCSKDIKDYIHVLYPQQKYSYFFFQVLTRIMLISGKKEQKK